MAAGRDARHTHAAYRAWSGQGVIVTPPVSAGSMGDGLEAHSQLRKLRLREARNLCKVTSSKGEVGQALNLISQQHPDISLQQVRA